MACSPDGSKARFTTMCGFFTLKCRKSARRDISLMTHHQISFRLRVNNILNPEKGKCTMEDNDLMT
jgi:hypothetical protein